MYCINNALQYVERSIIKYLRRRKSNLSISKEKWESVVGLEIHAQIASNSKLFSGAGTDFARPVNSNVSLFDAAIPGTLPVLNDRCVEAGVLTALALSCRVNAVSMFDRKHYFYADLPTGYQITQQRSPLANAGHLKFQVYTPGVHKAPYTKVANIKQLQLEQDSGKSLHDAEASRSLVDLNRAGIPLMELVFEPDLVDGEEAAALVKELVMILQRLGTCSCRMEEGALRVDANVSVNRPGEPLGIRSEVKNIGSIRGVASAVKYEIQRQITELEAGGRILNETRAWDAQQKVTIAMRDKEVVQDYRYMPEPNLPPLHLNMGLGTTGVTNKFVNVEQLKANIPELPEETRENLCTNYHVTPEQAIILVNEDVLLQYFKDISKNPNRETKLIVNILINELLTLVNKYKIYLENVNIPSGHLGELVDLIQLKTVNLVTARKILEEIINGDSRSPSEITEKNNWGQIKGTAQITKLCEDVITENPKLVKQYLCGKTKVFSALLGKAAVKSEQRANMAEVTRILKELLSQKSNK
ncbi:Glutamyl-tRNA amidotransferase subunit B [Carabus blaptoides fortunei]